jgi:ribosomal protein L9
MVPAREAACGYARFFLIPRSVALVGPLHYIAKQR